jgi:hypothetical protein
MLRFPTYKNLVQNDRDLIGLIAYSLYKQDKLAFVDDHKSVGGEPDDPQMETFCRASNLPNRIASYRESAASLLQRLNGEVLEGAIDEVKTDYQAELTDQVDKLTPPSLSHEVAVHCMAGVLVWAVVALLIFCALVARNGFQTTVHGLTGYTIQNPQRSGEDH